MEPADVTHVNAHGTSTPLNDMAEAVAMQAVFGENPGPQRGPPPKGSPVTLWVPPGHRGCRRGDGHAEGPDPPDRGATARLTPRCRPLTSSPANRHRGLPGSMSNSFGFGGHNGSLVIGPA
ncbi:MAG: hypothetical protein Ct9H300mP12_05070 [Acidimicrobiales bacterium]|nr:MAG: hypothetical protein Ct9H300mP12_05070 [Acidimicrobiales bacterium]